KPVHLAVVGFVIITAQVQQAMQNQLLELVIQPESVSCCLSRGLFDRNEYVTEVQSECLFNFILAGRKRQDVCGAAAASPGIIQLSHHSIGDKHHSDVSCLGRHCL